MERLFVYGTLQPGGPNEHILTALGGTWTPATIKGNLVESGWGASFGYPGLVLDEGGNDIHGYVFAANDLRRQWSNLDAFEGEGYERILAPVILVSGECIQAYVYVLRHVIRGG